MSPQCFSFTDPIPPSAWSEHKPLSFLAKYMTAYKTFSTDTLEQFYAKDIQCVQTDGSLLQGAEKLWEYLDQIYSPFPTVERKLLSLFLVSDDERRTYKLLIQVLVALTFDKDGGELVELPQAFEYVIGAADEGEGTDGLQFRELKSYFDMGHLQNARDRVSGLRA